MRNFKKILSALLTATLLLFCFTQSFTRAENEQRGVIVNCKVAVNVRSGPGTKYKKIGSARKGAVYTITGKSGSFYAIVFSGRTGYVHSNYISVSGSGSGTANKENENMGRVVNCNIAVNVRSGPGTKYKRIGSAKKGAVYTVRGKSGSFYEIFYGSKIGYIHEHYLSVVLPSPAPSPAPSQKPDEPIQTGTKIVSGYYASWASYYGYKPDEIPAGVTHVFYAFANIGTDLKIKIGDAEVDYDNFQKLTQLKTQRPELKTLISVGGWTWSGKFSDMALTDESRTTFSDSAVAFMKQYGFDGIDIDWEYPVGGGMAGNTARPEDKENFTLLMAKLREKLNEQGTLDQKKYLLSFAGGAQTFYSNIELDKLGAIVDFAAVMTYDMHGPSTSIVTDMNAPLYTPNESSPQYKWSCDASIKHWTDRGFPKHKILMGIPFYGMKFNGVHNANNGLYQTFSSGGSIPYDAIAAAYLTDASYSRFTHPEARVPWLFNGSTFISYDDQLSIAEKAAYIKNAGLGGAVVWELSQNADGMLIGVIGSNIK